MSIPSKCTVLVIGGGPAGSYTASVLPREGVDTVLLESDVFPRYHVGESMLASIRPLLRFIDLDETFDKHGFTKKVGAAFKLNPRQREGYTDFRPIAGPNGYAWNVLRSESDDLIFQHARKCGAQVFDGVKVNEIYFAPMSPVSPGAIKDSSKASYGRPISASWSSKRNGTSGTLQFDYVVDASGRAGVLDKYSKARKYNDELKNVASWGYWKGTGVYAVDTDRVNSPFFEALHDGSGWAWFIPLHNGTTSVGVVMKQKTSIEKKKDFPELSPEGLYHLALTEAPNLSDLLKPGKLATALKHASDFSYSSSSYASPYARIVGDAGCFIDPFFSSGVHLAMVSGLSAATTICASIKGDCSETVAANWHSNKVADGYARFLLIVLSAYRQIRNQSKDVLSDAGADNMDHAFAHFRPVIQGLADATNKVTHAELSETLDFCSHAWDSVDAVDTMELTSKLEKTKIDGSHGQQLVLPENTDSFSNEEKRVINHIRARQVMRSKDSANIDTFTTDIIDGRVPHLEKGKLTLLKAVPVAG